MADLTREDIVKTAERRAFELNLRKAGKTYLQIAAATVDKFGIDNLPKGYDERYAWTDVKRELDKLHENNKEDAQSILELELQRLDEMQSSIWEKITEDGSYAGIDRVLRVMQRRADMLGLDAKYRQDSGEVTERNLLVSIPADLVAPDFLEVYRDIRCGNSWEYPLDGGRGSLKSTFATEAIIELMLNSSRITDDKSKWMHALGLRQVEKTIRESIFRQFQWSIEKLSEYNDFSYSDFKFTYSPLEITYIPTQQKIYFRGGDDPMNIKSIKPQFGYIGLLLFEEFDQFRGQEAVRSIVQSAFRGGDKAYRFECWNTPRTKAHWVNKYLEIPKEGRFHRHTTYLNVPHEWLGKIFFDEANHLKEVNPTAYEHEYLGIANGTGGLVFENVKIQPISDEQIAQFDHILHGLDWGYYPDPFSWGKMHYDAARMTLYIFDEYRANKQSNRQTYDYLVNEKLLTSNDLIIADSAEPKSIGDYREYGANIRGAEKGPDSVSYSIKWLQSLKNIIIDDRRAPYHAEEFLNYELEQDKNGEFISSYPDKNNHAIDDVRYATNLIWRVRGQ